MFKTNEQIEPTNIDRSRGCVVHSNRSAWRRSVEVQPGGTRNSALWCSFDLLDLDTYDLIQVIRTADVGVPIEHEIRSDQWTGRSDTHNILELGENIDRQKLIERIVLRVPFVTQPERYGTATRVEEPLSKPEKRDCGKISQQVAS